MTRMSVLIAITQEKNKLHRALELACSYLTEEQVKEIAAAMPSEADERGSVEPVACHRGHLWHDFGILGGRNVSWCPRCDTLAFTGQEPDSHPDSAQARDGSEPGLRERFESWHRKKWPNASIEYFEEKNIYFSVTTNNRWDAWQTSHAATGGRAIERAVLAKNGLGGKHGE